VIVECPVRASAQRSPRSLALVFAEQHWTYQQLDLQVEGWASELERRGVRRGDRLALLCGNVPQFVFLVHALARLGAILVPLSARWTEAEIAPVLEAIGPRLVIAPRPMQLIFGEDTLDWLYLDQVDPNTHSSAHPPEAPLRATLDSEAIQAILFTSGTTGIPKGAQLSVGNFAHSARASADNLGGDPEQRWLACLPLYHVGGLAMLIRCAWYGSALVLHERFDPDQVNASMERDGISHLSLVETALREVLQSRGPRPFPSSLKAALIGGGPASPELLANARRASLPALHTYGLTEATSQVSTERRGEADGSTAGRPLTGISVRIVDAQGQSVAGGKPGEIEVRGPTVMRGYFGDDAATAASFRGDWLRTLDIGSLDERGRLTVFARRADLILSGGENVYPAEVERALAAHPKIAAAAVIAQPDAKWGQVPVAAFVVRQGRPSADELERHCRSRLAAFKVPKRFVELQSLPCNHQGKLDRAAIRNLVERALERPGARENQSA